MGKRLLVSPLKAKTATKSGIILREQEGNEMSEIAKVTAVGGEVSKLKVGMLVVFKKYAPDEIEIEANRFILIHEEDVMAVVSNLKEEELSELTDRL